MTSYQQQLHTNAPGRTERSLIEEVRALGWTSWASFPPAPPAIHDREAEQELLAAAWFNFWPSTPLASEDFFQSLPRAIYEVLDSARACGFNPTISLVLRGLQELGIRGPYLEGAVRRLLEHGNTAVALNVDDAAHRVRSLAWRRRVAAKVDHLRTVLLGSAFSEADAEAAIDQLVEICAAQPQRVGT